MTGAVVGALGERDLPQQMSGIRLPGIAAEQLGILGLGGIEPAGTMIGERVVEQPPQGFFVERRHVRPDHPSRSSRRRATPSATEDQSPLATWRKRSTER